MKFECTPMTQSFTIGRSEVTSPEPGTVGQPFQTAGAMNIRDWRETMVVVVMLVADR